jgi:hypothetical protein
LIIHLRLHGSGRTEQCYQDVTDILQFLSSSLSRRTVTSMNLKAIAARMI